MNFSFDSVKDFDKHINTSVPGYADLSNYIVSILGYFLNESTVVDIGCSTGKLLSDLSEKYPDNRYIGIDKSNNLLSQAQNKGNVKLLPLDILTDELPQADIYTSIFTIQFLPINRRRDILRKIYENLPLGNCLIISEKIYIDSGRIQDIFHFSHYDYKERYFSVDEIYNKQKDLRKIMRPLTEAENINMLNMAGFYKVEPFWQNLCFKAWICIK